MADYRFVKCKFWSDTYIESLPGPGKAIYLWGFTNEHTTLSGIYNISKKKISDEVGFDLETVSKFLDKFIKDGKIVYTKDNLIWFKNFLIHQPGIRGEKNMKKIADELEVIQDEELIEQFLDYYSWLAIPYKKKPRPKAKKKSTKWGQSPVFTEEEKKILEELKEVKGFPYNPVENIQYIRKLQAEFPDIDALNQIKRKCSWWKDNPLKENSRAYLQIRNWFEIEQKRINESKRGDKVGLPEKKEPEIDKFGFNMKERHKLFSLAKEKGSSPSDFIEEAEKRFPKFKKEWEESDKKPESFIRLFNKYQDPF